MLPIFLIYAANYINNRPSRSASEPSPPKPDLDDPATPTRVKGAFGRPGRFGCNLLPSLLDSPRHKLTRSIPPTANGPRPCRPPGYGRGGPVPYHEEPLISPDFSLELTGFFPGKHLIHFLVLKMKDFWNFVLDNCILDFDAEQVYLKLQVTNLKNNEVTANPKTQTLDKIWFFENPIP